MTSTGRVFVDFYDYANLGDDLLFVALARRYPEQRFEYIADRSEPAAFANLANTLRRERIPYVDGVLRRLRVPLRVNDLRRRRAIRRSHLAIRLGGSLYMETDHWRMNARRDAELLENPRGVVFLNGNFGPWRSREFLQTYLDIFSRAVDVTVRDARSYDQLAEVPQVRLAPDLLFGLPTPARRNRAGVVVSMIDLARRADLSDHRAAYESAMAGLVEDLVSRAGQEVTLMSFCASEGDEDAIERTLSLVPGDVRDAVRVFRYRGDHAAALDTLQQAETIVATRFHAMVLGLASGCRVACIEYSNKVTNALADLGLEQLGRTVEQFVAASRPERYDWLMAVSGRLPQDVPGRAAGHFAVLDELLATT